MTRSDLRTQLRALLKEETAGFWTDATLDTFLNQALRSYSVRLGLTRKQCRTSAVVNQEAYQLPTDFVARTPDPDAASPLHYVTIDGRDLEWRPPSWFRLAASYGTGAGFGVLPLFYTVFDAAEVATGMNLAVRLLPVPNASVADNILIGYERKPSSLDADAAVPGIPEEDHLALAWGAAVPAFLQRNQTEEAAAFQALFDRTILERRPAMPMAAAASAT